MSIDRHGYRVSLLHTLHRLHSIVGRQGKVRVISHCPALSCVFLSSSLSLVVSLLQLILFILQLLTLFLLSVFLCCVCSLDKYSTILADNHHQTTTVSPTQAHSVTIAQPLEFLHTRSRIHRIAPTPHRTLTALPFILSLSLYLHSSTQLPFSFGCSSPVAKSVPVASC
jgi:hypothetical protein